MRAESNEGRLIREIRETESDEERSRLIADLEALPVRYQPFYRRWLLIHEVDPYACWTDDGYDSSACELPRDIQILEVVGYGVADIDNGGLHQFFTNGTGVCAPEMIEWFDRSGLHETADLVREAVEVFGRSFPRSQEARQEFLRSFDGKTRAEWDPFNEMDDRFYDSLPGKTFDDAADRWLRETCAIRSLSDPPGGSQ